MIDLNDKKIIDEILRLHYAGKKHFVIIREIKNKYDVNITKKEIQEAMIKKGKGK